MHKETSYCGRLESEAIWRGGRKRERGTKPVSSTAVTAAVAVATAAARHRHQESAGSEINETQVMA